MLSKEKVLVIDRDKNIQDLLKNSLEDEGYTVFSASKNTEAYNILKKRRECKIILADISLASCGMDIISFIKKVKKLDKDIFIILTSDFSELNNLGRKGIEAGAYGCILRPLDINLLQSVVTVGHVAEKIRLVEENRRLIKINSIYGVTAGFDTGEGAKKNLLQCIAYCAVVQTASSFASVMLWGKQKNGLQVYASAGESGEKQHTSNTSIEKGMNNFRCMKILQKSYSNVDSSLRPKELSIPLKSSGKTLGVLYLYKENGAFTDYDLHIGEIVSSQLANYLEKSDLVENLQGTFLSAIESLSLALEARDHYTHGHSKRVRFYAMQVGKKMGLSEESIDRLGQGGLIHDIGKIGIRDKTLNKKGRLTQEEYRYFLLHPEIGYYILKPFEPLHHIRDLVRHHHERFDGDGYPDRLEGNKLTMEIAIISLVDAFDAMDSNRPYRDALSEKEIKEELIKNSGSQFHPEVVKIVLGLMEERKFFKLDNPHSSWKNPFFPS